MCVKEIGRIRLMEEKDVKQVEQVEKQCFSVPWSEHILKDGLTGRFDTYLVWEKGGIIAGYCALRVLADEGEIQRIAVLPWNSQKPDGSHDTGIQRKGSCSDVAGSA